MDRRGGSTPCAAHAAAVVLLAGFFLLVASCSTAAHYRPATMIGLAAIYLALAATLHLGLAMLFTVSFWLGAVASPALAAVVLWHLRLQTEVPTYRLEILASLAVSTASIIVIQRRITSGWTARPLAVAAAASAIALGAALTAGFFGSNDMRWHLLRHNRVVGTPVALLLGLDGERARDNLWEAGLLRSPGPSPAPIVSRSPISASDAPDIVFVMVDTLRADSFAAYGAPAGRMPEMDALVEDALVFDDVRSNAAWTKASIGSMFTGLLPEEHGAVDHGDVLPAERLTMAELLADAGYRAVAFVTNWANVGRSSGFAQGFEHFTAFEQVPYARAEVVSRTVLEWLDEVVTRQARDDVPRRPTFLYVHYLDPHTPYQEPMPGLDLPEAVGTLRAGVARAAYDAELSYVDGELARFIAAVRARMGEDTIFFLTSDHGEEFGEHDDRGHGRTLYPELVHLPAFLWLPGGLAGRVDARLEGRDYFDLIVRLAHDPKLNVAAWANNRSRTSRYASQFVTRAEPFFRPHLKATALRSLDRNGLVLIWSGFGDVVELYDHAEDPEEFSNLADRRPGDTASLRAEMEGLIEHWVPRVGEEQSEDTVEMLRHLGYVQ